MPLLLFDMDECFRPSRHRTDLVVVVLWKEGCVVYRVGCRGDRDLRREDFVRWRCVGCGVCIEQTWLRSRDSLARLNCHSGWVGIVVQYSSTCWSQCNGLPPRANQRRHDFKHPVGTWKIVVRNRHGKGEGLRIRREDKILRDFRDRSRQRICCHLHRNGRRDSPFHSDLELQGGLVLEIDHAVHDNLGHRSRHRVIVRDRCCHARGECNVCAQRGSRVLERN